ncbi:hypothetical protein WA026_011992 [Henosepilachna vigintioctopunctata]|uniref:Uncharacterized protein n=1 Tax=Henosepilachna vigintioctopunctata TaxID=420089 RepID=A0AAW1VCW7_9CUCU
MVLPYYKDVKPPFQYSHYQDDTDKHIKYRSIVSSSSVNIKKFDDINAKTEWTHIGGNISRLPPLPKKYSLVNKVHIKNSEGIHSVAISPKKRQAAFGLSNGEIQLRKINTITHDEATVYLREADQPEDTYSAVTCLRFVPSMDHILFSCDLTGRIEIFDTDKMCKHLMVKENNEINSIDVNYTGTKVISGGKDATLRIYDGETGKMLNATVPIMKRGLYANPKKYHQLRIYCVKFHQDNYDVFYSGGIDGYVKVWDLRDNLKVVRTINGPYIHGDAIDQWGKVLLTGSWRASRGMDLWDAGSGRHMETLIPTNRSFPLVSEFYECVKFFFGEKTGTVVLAGGSGTERLEVFDLAEKRIDFSLKVNNTVKSIDSTCCTIVCGGLDGVARVVKFHKTE